MSDPKVLLGRTADKAVAAKDAASKDAGNQDLANAATAAQKAADDDPGHDAQRADHLQPRHDGSQRVGLLVAFLRQEIDAEQLLDPSETPLGGRDGALGFVEFEIDAVAQPWDDLGELLVGVG